jgi:beta-galactosidase
MGCNSYRASHNPPSPSLLDACDELGMLVMDETRMFGTGDEALRQLKSLVMRDINRPSVVIWSIGNEEMSIQRQPWTKKMAEKVSRFLLDMDDTLCDNAWQKKPSNRRV